MAGVPKRYFIAFLAFIGCMNLLLLMKYFKLVFDTSVPRTELAHRIALGFTCVGGIIATRIGGVICFGIGIAASVIINLLIILSNAGSYISLGYLDFVDGLFQALAISAIADIWSRWAPLQERSRLMIFTFAGIYFAPTELLLLPWFRSWKDFLLANSAIIVIWCVIWFFIIRNDPSEDAALSHNEKQYLMQHTILVDRPRRTARTYLWSRILRSKPFWALCASGFILYVGVTFVSLEIPNYVKEKIGYNAYIDHYVSNANEEDTVIHLCIVAYFFVLGYAADLTRQKTNYTSTQIRKFYVCVGFAVGVAALFVHWSGAVEPSPFFLIFQLSRSFVETAILVNVIDISPNYSSLVWGIVKTFMTLGDLSIRYGILLTVNGSKTSQDICFHALEILYVVGALLYYFLGSAELQFWNNVPIDDQELRRRRNNV